MCITNEKMIIVNKALCALGLRSGFCRVVVNANGGCQLTKFGDGGGKALRTSVGDWQAQHSEREAAE